MRSRYRRVLVDVGTGDGRFAYRAARARPDRLVVGLDPAWRRMVPSAVRAARRPARGGAPNLLLVRGVAEDPPEPLRGAADEITVLMPWSGLLAGLLRADPGVCGGLRALARTGAAADVVIGTSAWRPPVPLRLRGLPEPTREHVASVLAPSLAGHGWKVTGLSRLGEREAAEAGSSWMGRLSSGGTAAALVRLTMVAV